MKKVVLGFFLSHVIAFSISAQSGQPVAGKYLEDLYHTSPVFDTTRLVNEDSELAITDTLNAWKNWLTVDNYFFGKNRGSLPMIADLESLHPYFKDKIQELMRVCKASGITLAVVETYRTHAKQSEYFGMGKKYTQTPGGKSKHQYGLAVDVVPIVDSVAVWNNARLWRKIGLAGERLGLRWGGRWRMPYDPAHFEWSGGVTSHQLAKGLLPKIPASKKDVYPCIEDDIKLLQTYWEAWEIEQSVMAKNPSDDLQALMP
jgi:peptidoglycan L-alanyl-D-glutamate endopeptidase CwlK